MRVLGRTLAAVALVAGRLVVGGGRSTLTTAPPRGSRSPSCMPGSPRTCSAPATTSWAAPAARCTATTARAWPPWSTTPSSIPRPCCPANAGCGLTNHPDGSLYTNTSGGVVNLNADTGAVLRGPFGPGGRALGIRPDPLTGNIVYVGGGGTIYFVNQAFTSSATFSSVTTGSFVDGIFFPPPTGNTCSWPTARRCSGSPFSAGTAGWCATCP